MKNEKELFFLVKLMIILMRMVLQVLAPLMILGMGIALIIVGLFQMQYPLFFQFLLFLFLGLVFIFGIVLLTYAPTKIDFLALSAWFLIIAILFFFFASFTYIQLPNQEVVIVTRDGRTKIDKGKNFSIKIRPFGSKIQQNRGSKINSIRKGNPFLLFCLFYNILK